MFQRQLIFIERHWRWLAVLAWALFAAWLLYSKWNNIAGFVLTDTDDNMRLAQVRALMLDHGLAHASTFIDLEQRDRVTAGCRPV